GCGPNEEMKKCSNACFEKNCEEEKLSKQCSFVCGAPKCQCAEGFLRDLKSRACVRPSQCNPIEIPTSTTTEITVTDNTIPCGDLRCHPAWSCQRISLPCTNSSCPPDAFFCRAPHTIPPPDCGGEYCSSSERCETIRVSCTRRPCPPDRKVCTLLPGATSVAPPALPSSCGPDGLVCGDGESCNVGKPSCTRLPCPPPVYSCEADGRLTTPSSEENCSSVRCPRGQICRVQQV
ncbi:hypothetical protein PMAYCL1PPCAC_28222, partial [Pristionchus mayeri]